MTSEVSPQSCEQTRLISRSSILILGGVLVGILASEALRDGTSGIQFYTLLAALFGLLSFIGLDAVGQRRKVRAEQHAEEKAAARLEQRVQRHLHDESSKSDD